MFGGDKSLSLIQALKGEERELGKEEVCCWCSPWGRHSERPRPLAHIREPTPCRSLIYWTLLLLLQRRWALLWGISHCQLLFYLAIAPSFLPSLL